MIKPSDLIALFQQALNAKWGYIWGAYGQTWTAAKQHSATREMTVKYGSKWIGHRVADCSGLVYWAFKQLGGTIYHGSHTMYRDYTTARGDLKNGQRTDGQPLKPGTAVFKKKKATAGQKSYNGYNYHHVGLYIGDGTVIEAKGTINGVVTSKVSTWNAWGELKGVSYAEGGEKEMKKATVVLPSGASGSTVNMRESASRSAKIVCQVPVGASVDVIQDKGEWCYIQYNGKTGYMMSNYLEYEGQDGESGDYLSPEEIAEIQKALKDIENATETIGRIVGRG